MRLWCRDLINFVKNYFMKKIGLILVAFIVTLMSCVKTGQGEMITQKFDVGSFDEIDFDGVGNVDVIPSTTFAVDVEAQENIMKIVEVKKVGSVLKIGLKPGYSVSGKTKIHYTVYANGIVGLKNTGSGSMKVKDGALGENLNVKNTGSGDIDFISSALIKKMDISGTGSGNVEGVFTSENVIMKNTGSGNFKLNFNSETVDLKNTGSGKITLVGSAITFEPTITGSGDIYAYDFPSTNAIVKTTGSGNATINVSSSLNVSISGSGDVRYKGNPTDVNISITGSGKVIKIN